MASAKTTPVMEQHGAAKRAHPGAIVFFRLGDFYEMFGEDAVLCARVLNLTLTSRNKGKPDEVPMAGVPHHAAHVYIGRLLDAGYRIAICEQMADPKLVKGIVPRDVVRVLSPGLITHDDHLRAAENNWLAVLHQGAAAVALALLDISTGELRVALLANLAGSIAELAHAAPRELLLSVDERSGVEAEQLARELSSALGVCSVRIDSPLQEAELAPALAELARDAEHYSELERVALGRVLRYARAATPGVELPVRAIGRWDPSSAMVIDASAQRHLELVESSSGDAGATLLAVIDETRTPAGARLLRRRLLSPLCDVERIRRRLDAVELFVIHAALRQELREILSGVGDLERTVSRVVLGEASPKDLGVLRNGLLAAERALELLVCCDEPSRQVLGLGPRQAGLSELAQRLDAALVERPPALAKEGAIFRPEFDAELSELDRVRSHGSELIAALEGRLREQTGISTLRVRFTRVFGWYIEVSRGQVRNVPGDWRRKQTVASGERYTVAELDDLAERIASAEEQHRARELDLLRELSAQARAQAQAIRDVSARIARWDVAAALADVAHRYDYSRPEVELGTHLELTEARHPVVERLAAAGRFVPNDLHVDADGTRLWIVTGPNMAGKSTMLRQVALITILSQLGSFVPASRARIGLADRVLSRVGASDNLARGQSTFMVEMRETAEILRSATKRSLVILDEIGRGTSTFDGLAIAWAVAEHLDEVIGCRALFATHYHELTAMAAQSEHVDNCSVSAKELEGDVVFLHRVVHGAASQSYGVAVAKLAGLPEVVLVRARTLLAELEGQSSSSAVQAAPLRAKKRGSTHQLDLFASAPAAGDQSAPQAREVLEMLREVNVDRLSPLDALQLLVKLKKRLS